ncbi:hypothetical protein POSPLADRAFT_1047682 [Postia placenta MAD-698-R-SB12]|uniref:Mediator complex subunit 20 n=2 Tax=Rhodonia placenta TaxID=104341 RepID=A0A1X6MV19_9APHY|nr:hypothetical protein POSPLADRAFT_1047682 [Postia placenta MAD-698-R-SB12]OSX60215.1 hypothetical protein POSPLADRAFT_1047682 [Postia placenta MAD-698-R-SB12]
MGVTGLARWINAPTTGVELVRQNITRNHQGVMRGKWQLSLGSWRSSLGAPNMQIPERAMYTVTMNDNVFVQIEDPGAPTRAEIPQLLEAQGQSPRSFPPPPHYRNTLMTVSPPGALEQLIAQLRARWLPVRGAPTGSQKSQNAAQQVTVDGLIYSIGNDWLIRFGHVILAGGAVKGMLIEAEYLPLPALHEQTIDGSSELLIALLTSVIPITASAKMVAVTVADTIWEEVLGGIDDEDADSESDGHSTVIDDIFVSPDDLPRAQPGDWTGLNRDRRSAYLIVGALKQEGLI